MMLQFKYQILSTGQAINLQFMVLGEVLPAGWQSGTGDVLPDIATLHQDPYKSGQQQADADPPRLWSLGDLVSALNIDTATLPAGSQQMLGVKTSTAKVAG